MKKTVRVLILCMAMLLAFTSIQAYAKLQYDFILMFDSSGSMSGAPLAAVKIASVNLVKNIFSESPASSIALLTYNSEPKLLSGFTGVNGQSQLESIMKNFDDSGGTIMKTALEETLNQAVKRKQLLNRLGANASNKITVIFMSDGQPMDNNINEVYLVADNMHTYDYIDVYTVGFFQSLRGMDLRNAENVLRNIASDSSKFFVVDNVNDFGLVFLDISEILLDSQKIIIWVECPVDVSITHGGETLNKHNTRTSFGTLQFEGEFDEKKLVRLSPEFEYNVELTGTDSGLMDYTIKYANEDGEYTDIRKLVGIPVESGMSAITHTAQSTDTMVFTDYDGDGLFDETFVAAPNQKTVITEHTESIEDYNDRFYVTESSYYKENPSPVNGACAFDGDSRTAWCEGVNGAGIGEWVNVRVTDDNEYRVTGLTITTGYTKSDKLWMENSRVAGLDFYCDGVYVDSFKLRDTMTPQTFYLKTPIVGSDFMFIINSFHQGSVLPDNRNLLKPFTCISEIEMF